MGLLRFCLAMTVVFAHLQIIVPFAGGYAVEIFFVISGFCMGLVLNEKYTSDNPVPFYVARYLKLWPTYVVVLVITCFATPLTSKLRGCFPLSYFYFSTFSLVGHETLWWFKTSADGSLEIAHNPQDFFLLLASDTHMQQMWSVGIELFFYLSAPFYARRTTLSVALLPFAFAVHLAVNELPLDNPLRTRSGASYWWIFLIGICAYKCWRQGHQTQFWSKHPISVASVSLAITALLVGMAFVGEPFRNIRNDSALVIIAALLIPLFDLTRSSNFDRMIGEFSYPIYVAHWPLLPYYFLHADRGMLAVAVFVIATISAALALRFLVERPVDVLRRRIGRGSSEIVEVPAGLVAATALRSAARTS
jgi:peptidoglycan/LPS O-acetylase OafA/YrhL